MINRLLHGIGANALAQLVVLVVQFSLVPAMATHWGLERYGTWLLLSTIPSYLSLGDFGFATAAASDMTMKVARGDRDGALVTFQSVWCIIVCVSAVVAALVVGGGLAAPDSWIPGATAASQYENRYTLIVLVLFAVVCLQGSITQAGFQCSGKYSTGISLSAVSGLVEGLAAVTIVVLGGSLVEVALTYLMLRTASLLLQAVILARLVPWLRFGIRRASREEVRKLWHPAVAVMALPLAQGTILQGTAIAIGLAVSPAAVPAFTAVRTLTRTGIQVATMLNHAIMPEMAIATALNDRDREAEIVTVTLLGSLLILVPLAVGLLLFGHQFIAIWTRGAISPPMYLIPIMTAVMIVQGFWHPLSNLLLAINRQSVYSFTYLSASFLSLAVTFVLAVKLAAVWATLSLLAVDVFMAFYIGTYASAHLLQQTTAAGASATLISAAGRLSAAMIKRRHVLRS